MNDKSLARKRLLIFLTLAFSIAWIPWIILNRAVGYDQWFNGPKSGIFLWALLISGGSPAIANILTRLITKEGFEDDMLRLHLRGNVRYYIMALLTPMILAAADYGTAQLFGADRKISDITALGAASLVMQALWVSPVMAFNTFGEEYGWRAYMNPKLEALTNRPVTITSGGIIWGIWHAPLTVQGHNFGKDYPGFPWLGIIIMSVSCAFLGMFLMWLTVKTGSVYPAAIAHSSINNGGTYIQLVLCGGSPATPSDLTVSLISMLPTFIICAVFGAMLLIKPRPSARRPKSEA